ncbi:MAG: Na+/H+-exchanging protein [Candidatus Sumerlaea sp.]|nr:MAG: Na+/H+-exchanging protein [Candidatus Sumerlaea sp.]
MLRRGRFYRALLLAVVTSVLYFFVTGQSPLGFASPTAGESVTTAPAMESSPHSSSTTGVPESKADKPHAAGLVEEVLIVLILILLAAKVGGDLFERFGQPAVLGELIFGMVLGNLSLFHMPFLSDSLDRIVHDPTVDLFITVIAEIGVILLLFEVGLEATVREMVSVGPSSLLVACLGVVAPMALGFLVGEIFLPQEPWTVHLYLGAVLAATSVGITARVLSDLGKMQLREAKIVLGAAVIDDVLGLIVLAAVQGIITAVNSGQQISLWAVAWIVVKALLFFILAIALGLAVSRKLFHWATYLRGKGILLTVTLIWCFAISYIAAKVGLAPIVGAFAAGLVLEEATFLNWEGREEPLEKLLKPVCDFLVPVFFVHMGMKVQLAVFAQWHVLGFALALTVAAIAGKQICALGVLEKGLKRMVVGLGMVPRGEVGLIVASIGAAMRTPEGHSVIATDTFSAIVIMVVVTTMMTPPLLKWALSRRNGKTA